MANVIYGVTAQTPQAKQLGVLVDLLGRLRLAAAERYETATVDALGNPISLTNITTNTTGYLYFDLEGDRYCTVQGETSGTAPTDVLTCTIESTTQTTGTVDSRAYQDITQGRFGVASAVDENFFWEFDTPITATAVRIKYVTSNASGNDCDLAVYFRRQW